jgi:hypothetical protein
MFLRLKSINQKYYKMNKKDSINVQGAEILLINKEKEDYILLADMAKVKDSRSEVVIQNWLRTRMTIELSGLWETLYNPNFKYIEFDVFKNQVAIAQMKPLLNNGKFTKMLE